MSNHSIDYNSLDETLQSQINGNSEIDELTEFYHQHKTEKVKLISGGKYSDEVYQKILCGTEIPFHPTLRITWKKERSLPTSLQECGMGLINDHLVYFGGYCAGGGSAKAKKGKYSRGFSSNCFVLELNNKNSKWTKIGKTIGQPRQGLRAISIDRNGSQQIFTWGGWSFTPMKAADIKKLPPDQWPEKKGVQSFSDGACLQLKDDKWIWNSIPGLPFARSNFGICYDKNRERIYIGFGGYAKNGQMGSGPSFNDIYYLDLNQESLKWSKLTTCPGSQRINNSMTCIGNYLYVLGGIWPDQSWRYKNPVMKKLKEIGVGKSRFYTVLDSWKLNLETLEWSQIGMNHPMTGNWGGAQDQVAIDDRYIMLMGGAYFPQFKENEKLVRQTVKPCGCRRSHCGHGATFLKQIFIYDLVEDKFYRCQDDLPGMINLPIIKTIGHKIHLIAGESYGFRFEKEEFCRTHLDINLVGEVTFVSK